MLLTAQKALPQISTQVPDVVAMDEDRPETSYEFEQQARHTILEKEEVGIVDIYSNIQPTSAPSIDKGFIEKRLDICLQYFLDDGGTELRRSQGGVMLVSDGTNIPKKQGRKACYKAGKDVMIRWGKNKERNKAVSELPQSLLRSKWNPMATHGHDFCRFDIEIRNN